MIDDKPAADLPETIKAARKALEREIAEQIGMVRGDGSYPGELAFDARKIDALITACLSVSEGAIREAWQPIENLTLGKKALFWNPLWRAPFPGIHNGPGGQVYVDCAHGGSQEVALYFQPLPSTDLSSRQKGSTPV